MANSDLKNSSKLRSKLTALNPSSIRKGLLIGLILCLVLINVDFIFHHFGHAHAWQSPLYLVTVSVEMCIILTSIILRIKKII